MRTLACLLALAVVASLPAAAGAASSPSEAPAAAAAAKKKKKKLNCSKKAIKKLKGKAKRKRVAACKKARKKAKKKVVAPPPGVPRVEGGADDAVVVAVIDGGINPHHWDFVGAKMPQHQDSVAGNDLPLTRPATEWLPGMDKAGFSSLEARHLNLDLTDPARAVSDLYTDGSMSVKASGKDKGAHAIWFPGTKVIGAMAFGTSEDVDLWGDVNAHGVGTTSSAVGNIHGTCPECLLFFIDYGNDPEGADEWAESQPWIDVISHSYGHGSPVPKVYSGSDTEAQRKAVDRGQTLVWSAGNGIENAYTVPNPTTYSSQKGPDWLVTVGAVTPGEGNHYDSDGDGSSFFGAGKPVDVAGVGRSYPNAYTASNVGGTGTSGFGGTSNAAPTIAGLYSRALYLARTRLSGPSRTQEGGKIAVGAGFTCAATRPDCELGDGVLTGSELRTRLFHGAVHSAGGMTGPSGQGTFPAPAEAEFANEGHGTYFARHGGPESATWLAEFDQIMGPLEGRHPARVRPEGELEWMIVDSYCRQKNWGSWTGGYYVEGTTQLPPDDPAWPARNGYKNSCPGGPTG